MTHETMHIARLRHVDVLEHHNLTTRVYETINLHSAESIRVHHDTNSAD